jgi:hypothetical protein
VVRLRAKLGEAGQIAVDQHQACAILKAARQQGAARGVHPIAMEIHL